LWILIDDAASWKPRVKSPSSSALLA